jgi:uncharacterized protein YgiM (DUF1202 family)
MLKEINKKYLIGGGIAIALLLIGLKVFAKDKTTPVKRKKTSIEIGELESEFATPAETTSRQGTRLRSDSNTNSKILHTYQNKQKLIIIDDKTESDGVWYKVTDVSGRTGWVRSDVVGEEEKPAPKSLDEQLREWELYNV